MHLSKDTAIQDTHVPIPDNIHFVLNMYPKSSNCELCSFIFLIITFETND